MCALLINLMVQKIFDRKKDKNCQVDENSANLTHKERIHSKLEKFQVFKSKKNKDFFHFFSLNQKHQFEIKVKIRKKS